MEINVYHRLDSKPLITHYLWIISSYPDVRRLTQTAHVHVVDKVVKLKEERDLFTRFVIIHGSRPGLAPKIEETIGQYEMSVVPHSLFAVNGSLLIPKDKYKMMTLLEEVKNEHQLQNSTVISSSKVVIIDAMTYVHP